MPQESENKTDLDLILAKLNSLENRMSNVEEALRPLTSEHRPQPLSLIL